METFSPARPAIDLSSNLQYPFVGALTGLLPPLDEAPTGCEDQGPEENVSEIGISSHDAAFETLLSGQPSKRIG